MGRPASAAAVAKDHLEAVGHRDAFLYMEELAQRRTRLREQEILSDQLRLTPPWDRIAAVEQAITAQSRSFRSFVPQSPPGTLR